MKIKKMLRDYLCEIDCQMCYMQKYCPIKKQTLFDIVSKEQKENNEEQDK